MVPVPSTVLCAVMPLSRKKDNRKGKPKYKPTKDFVVLLDGRWEGPPKRSRGETGSGGDFLVCIFRPLATSLWWEIFFQFLFFLLAAKQHQPLHVSFSRLTSVFVVSRPQAKGGE